MIGSGAARIAEADRVRDQPLGRSELDGSDCDSRMGSQESVGLGGDARIRASQRAVGAVNRPKVDERLAAPDSQEYRPALFLRCKGGG